MLEGLPIMVCTANTVDDDAAGHEEGAFVSALQQSVNDWNDALGPDRDVLPARERRGLDYPVFEFDAASHECPQYVTDDDSNTDFIRVFDMRECPDDTVCDGPYARVYRNPGTGGALPRVNGNTMEILPSGEQRLFRSFRHELGHMLGLGDYTAGCWRVVSSSGAVESSVISYGRQLGERTGDCFSAEITDRDLADLHAIYHPVAVRGLALDVDEVAGSGRATLRWAQSSQTPAAYNSYWLGVFTREGFVRDPLTGAPSKTAGWTSSGRVAPDATEYSFPDASDLIARDVAVAGLTRGDHEAWRSPDTTWGLEHGRIGPFLADIPDRRVWSLGEPAALVSDRGGFYGVRPLTLGSLQSATFGRDGEGQWQFAVYARAGSLGGRAVAAGDLVITQTPAQSQKNSPFTSEEFVPVIVRYANKQIQLNSCADHFVHAGRYRCHISETLPTTPHEMPLRVIVDTAPDTTRTALMQGAYQWRYDDDAAVGVYEYALPDAGNWRFLFTAASRQSGHATGDLLAVNSNTDTGFDNSLFDGSRFPDVTIEYDNTKTELRGRRCAYHPFNSNRYQCWITNAFGWKANSPPTEISIRPLPAPADTGAQGTDKDKDAQGTDTQAETFPPIPVTQQTTPTHR